MPTGLPDILLHWKEFCKKKNRLLYSRFCFHSSKLIILLTRQEYEDKLKTLAEEKEEQESLVAKLTQAAKDKEVEYRIANKKTDNLVS